MNEEIYNILESCLQDLDSGVDIETILSRHLKFANELRPILQAAALAKNETAPAPSQDAVIRGRARLMQRAAELREGKIAPRKRIIPFFQRIAISFTLTATLLLSGTGLVGASSSALPGHKLYPVKRGWEGLRLFLTFNEDERDSLEQEIENERLHEVNELLFEDEHSLVDFSGVFTNANGALYVSDVLVVFPEGAQLPEEGKTIHIVGWTEKEYVEVIRFEILQGTVILPDANPIPSPAGTVEPQNSIDENSESSNQNTEVGEQAQSVNENENAPTLNDNDNIGIATSSDTQENIDESESESD